MQQPTVRDQIHVKIREAEPEGGVSFNRLAREIKASRARVHAVVAKLVRSGELVRIGSGGDTRLLPPDSPLASEAEKASSAA